jgi:hypothetical protein
MERQALGRHIGSLCRAMNYLDRIDRRFQLRIALRSHSSSPAERTTDGDPRRKNENDAFLLPSDVDGNGTGRSRLNCSLLE